MIAYIATTALLAAGSASAGDTISFPFRTLLQSASGSASSDNEGGHYTHTSKPQYEKSHYTKRSSITCTAKASTKGWSKAKDAHADAGALLALFELGPSTLQLDTSSQCAYALQTNSASWRRSQAFGVRYELTLCH